MTGPQLAILTPSRTPAYVERLSRALDACREAPEAARVLVNNAGTAEMTGLGLRYRWAVLEPGRNLSFSDANNVAAEAAAEAWPSLTHLLLLNDDAIPEPAFLMRLWQHRAEADVLGGLMLEADGVRVNHAGVCVVPSNTRTDHVGRGEPRDLWERDVVRYFANTTFAAVLVRRQLWEDLDGLDSTLIASHEDVDFCWRAIEAHATVGVVRSAVAIHAECGTRARGGMADHLNQQTIEARWKAKLPRLLAHYRQRLARFGLEVEGILE